MQYKGPVIWVCFKIYDSIMEWTVVCVCVCVCAHVSHSVMSNSLQPHGLVDGQDPLSMGLHRQEYWSELPWPSPGNLPNPVIEPGSPAWQTDSLPSEPPKVCKLRLHWKTGRINFKNAYKFYVHC